MQKESMELSNVKRKIVSEENEIEIKKKKIPLDGSNDLDPLSEPTICLQTIHQELFKKYNLRLIVANLSHLESYIKICKGRTDSDTLYSLIDSGRRRCFALQSLQNQEIYGFIKVYWYKQKLVNNLSFFNNQSVEILKADINEFVVNKNIDRISDYKKLVLLEILEQLKKMQCYYVDYLTQFYSYESQTEQKEPFVFLSQMDLSYTLPLIEHLKEITYKLSPNENKVLIEDNFGINNEPLISASINNIPKFTSTFSHKTKFSINTPKIAEKFDYLENFGLRLFIPQPDQLLPAVKLYLDGDLHHDYVNAILHKKTINDNNEQIYSWGIQDTHSDEILAMIFFKFSLDSTTVIIDSMVVIDQFQSKGIGALLLQSAIEELRISKCKEISLASSPMAYKLYCFYGFELQNFSSDITSDINEEKTQGMTRNAWLSLTLENKVNYCENTSLDVLILNLEDSSVLTLLDDRFLSLKTKISKEFTNYNLTNENSDVSKQITLTGN